MNQNHLFYRFTFVGQNLEIFYTDSPLKHFIFLLFDTVLTDSASKQSLNVRNKIKYKMTLDRYKNLDDMYRNMV